MKKILTLFALLLSSVVMITKSQAQDQKENQDEKVISACIHDGFGYIWTFTRLHVKRRVYSGKGTVDLGSGKLWTAYIDGNGNKSAGKTVTLRAINRHPDGCTSYVDSFTYVGSATESVDSQFHFSGSGTWTNYCSGSVLTSGTWSATDCATKPVMSTDKGNQPAGVHNMQPYIKVSPSPVINSANITYTLFSAAKVNITIYNSMQQPIKVLVNDFKNAGNYSVIWDTRSSQLNSGMYRVVALINGQVYSTSTMVVR